MLKIISKLGELNPQLFREIQGKLKTRNVVLTIILAALMSVIFELNISSPHDLESQHSFYYGLTFSAIIAILVAGTYTLSKDLAIEEQRGTLNFIRLSPQSPQSIFVGKMLGVLINMYIAILAAIPVHLWVGLKLNLPLHQILIFYIILLAASIFYYSGAILFALIGSWLGDSQVTIASGLIAVFLIFNQKGLYENLPLTNPLVLFQLIHPSYFIPQSDNSFSLAAFNWLGLPLGKSFILTAGFSLLIYSIGTYFIWKSIERCYHSPHATMLSKKQSYVLTATFTLITLGCTKSLNQINLFSFIFLNFLVFLYLIAALTPNHQTVTDWARYQHFYSVENPGNQKIIKDWIWGEKSPAILAIAINALIVLTSSTVLIAVSSMPSLEKISAVLALILTFTLLLIYAALAQLTLLMKSERRLLWTNSILAGVIFLPIIFVSILAAAKASTANFLWFFTIISPMVIFSTQSHAMLPLLALVGHASILGLLLFQIKGKLQKVGESSTKALLTPN